MNVAEDARRSPRVACLVKRWAHHTRSGGYDRLAQELTNLVISRRVGEGVFYRVARRFWQSCTGTGQYLADYTFDDYRAEAELIRVCYRQPPDVVHVLYGDEQLDMLLKKRRRLPFPLVATFHLPTDRPLVNDRFEVHQKDLIQRIDGAIAVARCQVESLSRWLGSERVAYVPHGIDVSRFVPQYSRPDHTTSQAARVVVVGGHMRDWQALHRIIDECYFRKFAVQFDVVGQRVNWPYFTGCLNTTLHADVSEETLIQFYQEADVLLLPLVEATANNALLEALACGTPVISNNVGGIPDYVDENCAWLYPVGEVERIVELLAHISLDRRIAQSKRAAARDRSLEFSWEKVAAEVRQVYRAAMDRYHSQRGRSAFWDRT